MRKALSVILVAFLSMSSYGCAVALIGAGVAGGVAISRDTAEIAKDTSYDKAWSVTEKTIKDMGMIKLQDRKAGKIEATVEDSQIEAHVTQITPKTVKVRVKARKNYFPNVDLAMKIVNKINEKL